MPTEKPMKVQWQQIDGRTVPFILPQYWDEDKQDWVISGTENPLPTQLTGSKVEQYFVNNQNTAFGTTFEFNQVDVVYPHLNIIFFVRYTGHRQALEAG